MIYDWASSTDVGRLRDHNEDAVHPAGRGTAENGFVAAVADGMGGHVAGEVASSLALEAAIEASGDPVARVRAGNWAVMGRIHDEPELSGMGTTLTLGVFGADGDLAIGHVGDSRAYLLREGGLRQLTRDHSLVAELVESGRLDPADAADHPFRSVITRALGLERDVDVDVVEERLDPGDRVLLCSDGLTSMIDDEAVGRILMEATDLESAVATLVEAANAAGGNDNITVVVVAAVADDPAD
jgi:protein phosphatase